MKSCYLPLVEHHRKLLRYVSDQEVQVYLRWARDGNLSPEWREAVITEAARRFQKGTP